MKPLRQIVVEGWMDEKNLPEPEKQPFENSSRSDLENALHDSYVRKYVNGTLSMHHWKEAEKAGWNSSPGDSLRKFNEAPAAAKAHIRLMGHHNHISLTSEQHSSKIFNRLRFHHDLPYDDWKRVSDIAKGSAAEILDKEHGLPLNPFYK